VHTREELIQWLRHAEPASIADDVVSLIDDGVDVDELWAVGALTAARYVSNQARNLLGFVSHAMIGCEDARQAAVDQPADIQRILLIQALSQVAVDLRDPCFAPYELFDVWGTEEATVADGIRELRSDVRFGEWMRADHRLVGLERTMPRDELIDLVLDIGLEGMVTDDHTFITTALSLDMMELTGWTEGFAMLRATMRYSCTFPRNFAPYDHTLALVEQYGLHDGITIDGFDAEAGTHLRRRLLAAQPAERPEMVARALAKESCSAQTVMSALAMAACDMYLRVDPVPHEDFDAVSREVAPIHIGTTLNVLRSSLPRMSPATAAKAVIMGGCLLERGPSVLNADFEFIPFVPARSYPYAEDVVELASDGSEQLLKTVDAAIHEHDVRTTTAGVAAFGAGGGESDAMIATLVRIACTDDGTLMHNVKHLHSCLGEFRASSDADRWNFLIAAAKWISWYAGKDTGTYQRALLALAA
jgi:hypothetical protein